MHSRVGSSPASRLPERQDAEHPLPGFSRWVLVVAALQLAALLLTSTRYGYHRDELYFIVAGGHPAFGYPDQPAIVPLLCAAMHWLAPGSLTLLRLPSAIASVATTVVAALVSRDLGGRGASQLVAAAGTAVSAFALAVGHFVTTTTFDLLSTTLVLWFVVRAVTRVEPRWLLLAGIVAGLGFEAKPQVALVAVVTLIALVGVGPREVLRSRWLVSGAVCAMVLAVPYVAWQVAHGLPQLTVAHNIAGSAEGGRIGFVPFQLVMVSPLLVPVWVAGLVAPWRDARLRTVRFVPVAYAALAVLYILGDGKAYYLAGLYPVVLGLGSLPVARWLARGARRVRLGLLTAAFVVSAVVSSYIALPLLPAADLQGSAVMALNPDQGESVGWPAFIAAVERAWRAVPTAERRHTAIFTANYGEAGAIDLLSRGALPRAFSGHNGFSLWGMPTPRDTRVLLVGYNGPADARPSFAGCRTLARVENHVGLENQEQGVPVMLCRPTASWVTLWPRLRHYD